MATSDARHDDEHEQQHEHDHHIESGHRTVPESFAWPGQKPRKPA
jgi:hypothetical protein